ncbi:MAG: tandem-95 repeat protein, partial [Acidimicrobiia bacterium]|nr:tandem-95 repeat protein [Acidimicrobiia bacterium]
MALFRRTSVALLTALAVLISSVAIAVTPVSAQANKHCTQTGFPDVPAEAFYACAVEWMTENGFVYGYDDGTFRPDNSATRGEFATFFWRYLGSNQPANPPTFPDVAPDAFYADAVAWMTENALIYGFPDGTFGPEENVTRAQQVTFLWRSAGEPPPTSPVNYPDTDNGAFYADALAWAAENGLAYGYPDGTFRPHDDVTRGELATFLSRFDQWDSDDEPSNVAPSLAPIGNYTAEVDEPIEIRVSANDPDNGPDPLDFSATGQPGGLTINSNTGTMSGRVGTKGTWNITVTVTDGEDEASRSFNLMVRDTSPPPTTQPTPPTTQPTPPPTTPQPPTTPPTTVPTPTNEPPVIEDATFPVAEDATIGAPVGNVDASDPDGDTLTYTITNGNTSDAFAIDSATDEITVATELDHETTPRYALTIEVSDGTGADDATITIDVTDVNEPPVVDPIDDATVDEDGEITPIGVSASDPDGNDLTLTATGLPDGLSFVDNPDGTGEITGTPTTPGDSEVTVTADDGNLDSEPVTFTITVTNINDDPVLGESLTFTVGDDAANGDEVGTIGASDEDGDPLTFHVMGGTGSTVFSVDENGLIIVTDASQLGTAQSFELEITVNDDNGGSDSGVATITVTDNPQPPVAQNATFSIAEDTAVGSSVGSVDASDPDGDSLSFDITSGNTGDAFVIDQANGEITVAAVLDFETIPSYTLTVEVAASGDTVDATITINITDVNEPPVVDPIDDATVDEDVEITPIGVSASDPDGDDLTLTATGLPDGLSFADNGDSTGTITGTPTTPGDSEVTVTANDGTVDSQPETFTITVTDVNEPPVAEDSDFDIAEDATIGAPVGTVDASDPDGDTLTYTITNGNTGDAFAIDEATGEITV